MLKNSAEIKAIPKSTRQNKSKNFNKKTIYSSIIKFKLKQDTKLKQFINYRNLINLTLNLSIFNSLVAKLPPRDFGTRRGRRGTLAGRICYRKWLLGQSWSFRWRSLIFSQPLVGDAFRFLSLNILPLCRGRLWIFLCTVQETTISILCWCL